MSWWKKNVSKPLRKAAGKLVGNTVKVMTGSNKARKKASKIASEYTRLLTDQSGWMPSVKLPKLPKLGKKAAAAEQAPVEEEEEGIEFPDYSEYFAQMQDALRAQAEAAAFVPDEQEPLKNAVSESSEAEDDLKRKQQRRSGVLSLYKRYLDSGYAWNGGGTGTALGGTSALGA